MKSVVRLLPILLLGVLSARAEEPVAPEQRISAIEQKYAGGARQEAAKEVKAWLKTDDDQPWPWVAAASLSFHDKKYKKCLKQAAHALERAPQSAEGYYWRGRCFEASGNALDAANEYRAALKAEAAHPRANEGLARIQASLDHGAADAPPTAN
jgi:predicted Zn-dependent protease